MKARKVAVELRLWSTRPENHLVRVPVAERGFLVANHLESEDDAPMIVVEGRPYAPWTEEAFASVLLILDDPSKEEVELLRAATEAGYCIEPRVVGEPWRDIEPLDMESEI